MLCLRCGYDASRDYGKYPTFGAVGRVSSASALQEQWQRKQNPPEPKQTVPPVEPVIPPPPKPAPPVQPKPQFVQSAAKQPVKVTPASPPADAVPKNKWIAFFLCLFLGLYGAHKYYEGKIGMGLLYTFTAGLLGYGWLFDVICLLFKPNPYYPKAPKKHT